MDGTFQKNGSSTEYEGVYHQIPVVFDSNRHFEFQNGNMVVEKWDADGPTIDITEREDQPKDNVDFDTFSTPMLVKDCKIYNGKSKVEREHSAITGKNGILDHTKCPKKYRRKGVGDFGHFAMSNQLVENGKKVFSKIPPNYKKSRDFVCENSSEISEDTILKKNSRYSRRSVILDTINVETIPKKVVKESLPKSNTRDCEDDPPRYNDSEGGKKAKKLAPKGGEEKMTTSGGVLYPFCISKQTSNYAKNDGPDVSQRNICIVDDEKNVSEGGTQSDDEDTQTECFQDDLDDEDYKKDIVDMYQNYLSRNFLKPPIFECALKCRTFAKSSSFGEIFEINTFFNSLPIRIIGTEKNPMFYAEDLGKLLGIKRIRDTIRYFKEHEIVAPWQKEISNIETYRSNGRRHKRMILLSEFGIYRILMNHESELAEKFRTWVYDVLYQIRNKGRFEIEEKYRQALHTINEKILIQERKYEDYMKKMEIKRKAYQNLCDKIYVFEIKNDPQWVKLSKNLHPDDQSSEESFEEDGFDYIDQWERYQKDFPEDAADRMYSYKLSINPTPDDFTRYNTSFTMYLKDSKSVLNRLDKILFEHSSEKKGKNSRVFFCCKEKIIDAIGLAINQVELENITKSNDM